MEENDFNLDLFNLQNMVGKKETHEVFPDMYAELLFKVNKDDDVERRTERKVRMKKLLYTQASFLISEWNREKAIQPPYSTRAH